MCGIVGYVGKNESSTDFVLNGLKALEYRGYDSAGLATIDEGAVKYLKDVGRVANLEKLVQSSDQPNGVAGISCGIGHTRWATHGGVTKQNAHPHTNLAKDIFVVCNGIIENYQEIRKSLTKKGYEFKSETDTEVIPHLIDSYLKSEPDFYTAFKKFTNVTPSEFKEQ